MVAWKWFSIRGRCLSLSLIGNHIQAVIFFRSLVGVCSCLCVLHQLGLFRFFHIFYFVQCSRFHLSLKMFINNHAAFWSASLSPEENRNNQPTHTDYPHCVCKLLSSLPTQIASSRAADLIQCCQITTRASQSLHCQLLLRFSSGEREADQNAAWLFINIFNKDDNVNNILIQTKNRGQPKTVLTGAKHRDRNNYPRNTQRIWLPKYGSQSETTINTCL